MFLNLELWVSGARLNTISRCGVCVAVHAVLTAALASPASYALGPEGFRFPREYILKGFIADEAVPRSSLTILKKLGAEGVRRQKGMVGSLLKCLRIIDLEV